MLQKGNVLSQSDLQGLRIGQRMVLSFGEGPTKVLAEVRVQQIPLKSAKWVRVTVNEIDPSTGSSAPADIQVNKTISAKVEHLFHPKQ